MNEELYCLVVWDYGLGSCFSCGGSVQDTCDAAGRGTLRCAGCGVVEHVVFESDTGELLQGFMSLSELAAMPGLEHDPDAEEEVPF